MARLQLAVLASAFGLSAARAQDTDCSNPQTQLEMPQCAQQDWQATDSNLNEAYKAAQVAMADIDAGLPEAEKGAAAGLRDGQRAWITYRDAACAAEGNLSHCGSIEPMVIAFCLARITKARATDVWMLSQQGE